MPSRRLFWRVYLFASGAAFCLLVFLISAFLYNTYLARYDVVLPAYGETTDATRQSWTTEDPEVVRILALNGGALLGLAELEVLKSMEEVSGRSIHELFDFVAGSSTGAIVGALLLLPEQEGKDPRTAQKALTVYEEFASEVLTSSVMHRVLTVDGLFGPLFTNESRIEIAQRFFGGATFGDLARPAMFPAFIHNESAYEPFRNWRNENSDLLLSSLLTAVTSAPIMFPSVKLSGYDDKETIVSDPAFVLSSPAHLAYVVAREEQPSARRFIVVTLSADGPFTISDNSLINGGIVQLFNTLTNTVFAGQRSLSEQALAAHSRYSSDVEVQSFSLRPTVTSEKLFDASEDNITTIRGDGVAWVQQNTALIDSVVAALK
ncbi:MAG: patatin-like phospholipase family protein [Pseudomonadota bacterium]